MGAIQGVVTTHAHGMVLKSMLRNFVIDNEDGRQTNGRHMVGQLTGANDCGIEAVVDGPDMIRRHIQLVVCEATDEEPISMWYRVLLRDDEDEDSVRDFVHELRTALQAFGTFAHRD